MMKEHICSNRREFLVKTTAGAGGILLSLSGQTSADTATPDHSADNIIVKLDGSGALAKVGGSQKIETAAGPVLIVRTGDLEFRAFSAKCTHKGGTLSFDGKTKRFTCPLHGSIFDAEGKMVEGPAKNNLPSYQTNANLTVNLS
jgi:Rieske Fe-S protein